MRRALAGLTVAGFVLALAAPALAKTETVKGQLVDEGCSLEAGAGHAMPAEAMAECAIECAKQGEPVALLTPDGKVYRVTGGLAADKNAKLIAHMNHTVEITGDVFEKDGKVQIAADTLKRVE